MFYCFYSPSPVNDWNHCLLPHSPFFALSWESCLSQDVIKHFNRLDEMGELCLEQWDLCAWKELAWPLACLTCGAMSVFWSGRVVTHGEVKAGVSLEDALADTLLAKHTKLARKQSVATHSVWRFLEVEQISPFLKSRAHLLNKKLWSRKNPFEKSWVLKIATNHSCLVSWSQV